MLMRLRNISQTALADSDVINEIEDAITFLGVEKMKNI